MEHLSSPKFSHRIFCAFRKIFNNLINLLAFVVDNDSVLCEFLNGFSYTIEINFSFIKF